MPTAAELTVKINAETSGAEAGINRVDSKVRGFASGLGTLFSTAGGFVLGAGITAVVGGVSQLAAAGLDFEAQMANVNSIMQLSSDGIADLSTQVLQLAQNPGITQGPAELAAGLYNIASSGFAGADGLKILEASAISATAGMTNADTSARAITAALNAYGLGAENAANISDMMFQTVNDGVISFEQLANNLGNTLPVAASLGIGFDQLGAAYAQMTLSGVNASAAETQISALMRSALAPTDALTAAVQAHGYASAEALISTEGLSGFLSVLTDASGGSKEALFKLLGTQEAMNAASLLGGDNLDAYNAELDKMQHASDGAGATQTALAKQMQSATFRITKAKQSVAILATTLMGGLAPAIGAGADAMTNLIIKGVIPFTEVIGGALKGTLDWQKAVDKFPAPLQRTVHALGSVADSVGDVVRAFGDRGLTGAIRTLVQGGELEQIGTALGAIGSELLSFGGQAIDATFSFVARWGGIVWGAATDAASWIKENAGDIAATGLDATVSFLTKWGGIVWGNALDAATWIKSNVPGLVANGVEATVDFVTKWGGIAWDTASDAGAWIKANIGDVAATGINATLSFLSNWGGISWGAYSDAGAWVKAQIGPVVVPALDATISIGTVSAATNDQALGKGQETGKSIGEKFTEGVTSGFEGVIGIFTVGGGGGSGGGGGGGGSAGQQPLSTAVENWAIGFVEGLGTTFYSNFTTNMRTLSNPFRELPGIISNWFTDAMSSTTFGANGSQDPARGFSAGQSPFDELSTIISNSLGGEIVKIAGKIPGYKDDLVKTVQGIIPDGDIKLAKLTFDLSGIEGSVNSLISTLDGWIQSLKDKWKALFQSMRDPSADYTTQYQNTYGINPNAIKPGDSGAPLGSFYGFNMGTEATPQSAQGSVLGLVKIDADTSAADQKVQSLSDKVTAFTKQPFSGILDFDNGPAAVKYTDTFNWGTVFDAATFTSTFDIDNGPAAVRYTDSFNWGTVWDAQTFTSTFAIDNGPAAVAYTDAFGWGNTWASQVFTASFSVDTSGITAAVDVARQAAADIAAVMPHSPAKEGPLKEPITFDYIADNMRGVADRLRGYAASGAGYVRDSFTDGPAWSPAAAAGRSGGGDTYVIITPDSEQFSEIARKARQGDMNWKTLSAYRQRAM